MPDYISEVSYGPADLTGFRCPNGSNSITVTCSISVSGINGGSVEKICIGANCNYSSSHSIPTTITVPLGDTSKEVYWSALVTYFRPGSDQRFNYTYSHRFTVISGIEPEPPEPPEPGLPNCATPTISLTSYP